MLTSNPPFTDTSPAISPRRPVPRNLASTYVPTELLVPAPGHCFRPSALNKAGLTVGNIMRPRRFEGASWTANGVCFPPLPSSPTETISAENAWPFAAVSSNGLIAGTRGDSDDTRRAWASHRGDFGQKFWPNALSFGQGVNAAGTVIGKTFLVSNPVLVSRGFALRESGRPHFFQAPEGGYTDAIAINDRGTVLLNITGHSRQSPRLSTWIHRDETYFPLETPAGCVSFGVAITSDDTVLGFVEPTSGPRYVGLWTQGQLTDINLPSSRKFRPHAINDELIAVGSAITEAGERTACRWSFGRGLEFLADHCPPLPGIRLSDAVGINQSGQILCLGRRHSQESGFLLNPVG